MQDPSASTIRVDLPGQGSFVIPMVDVATHRGAYMARQATGSGPAPGNDLYDATLEQETEFALDRPDILTDWAHRHMRRADLEPYRVEANQG